MRKSKIESRNFSLQKAKKKGKKQKNLLFYNFSHFSNDLFDFEKFSNFFRFEKSIDKAQNY